MTHVAKTTVLLFRFREWYESEILSDPQEHLDMLLMVNIQILWGWKQERKLKAGTFLQLIMFIVDSDVILPQLEATTSFDTHRWCGSWAKDDQWRSAGECMGPGECHENAYLKIWDTKILSGSIWIFLYALRSKKSIFGEDDTDSEEDERPPAPVHTGQICPFICTLGWSTE